MEGNLNQNKEKAKILKNPDHFQECSTEELQRRLEKTENRLRSDVLDKKEEARINQKIA